MPHKPLPLRIFEGLTFRTRRCYAVSAKGVYLGAHLVVFAANKAHARRLALAKLRMDEPGIRDPEIYDIEQITVSGAHVLFNGDY